jgi:hypothetical protein
MFHSAERCGSPGAGASTKLINVWDILKLKKLLSGTAPAIGETALLGVLDLYLWSK